MMNVLMAGRKLPSYFAIEDEAEPPAYAAAAPRPRPTTADARPAMMASRSAAVPSPETGIRPPRNA